MTQKNSTNTHATINPNHRPMIYYPIDDDDYESADFYKITAVQLGKSHSTESLTALHLFQLKHKSKQTVLTENSAIYRRKWTLKLPHQMISARMPK